MSKEALSPRPPHPVAWNPVKQNAMPTFCVLSEVRPEGRDLVLVRSLADFCLWPFSRNRLIRGVFCEMTCWWLWQRTERKAVGWSQTVFIIPLWIKRVFERYKPSRFDSWDMPKESEHPSRNTRFHYAPNARLRGLLVSFIPSLQSTVQACVDSTSIPRLEQLLQSLVSFRIFAALLPSSDWGRPSTEMLLTIPLHHNSTLSKCTFEPPWTTRNISMSTSIWFLSFKAGGFLKLLPSDSLPVA